jgi:hypothetical protein
MSVPLDSRWWVAAVCANDDLFHRLVTVHFFRLFTGEGDMENTGRGNTEHRSLKARVLP